MLGDISKNGSVHIKETTLIEHREEPGSLRPGLLATGNKGMFCEQSGPLVKNADSSLEKGHLSIVLIFLMILFCLSSIKLMNNPLTLLMWTR